MGPISPDFMEAGYGAPTAVLRIPIMPQTMINSPVVCRKRNKFDGRWKKVFMIFAFAAAAEAEVEEAEVEVDFIRTFINLLFEYFFSSKFFYSFFLLNKICKFFIFKLKKIS